MAQTATMGPPHSPKEPRRSGRRTAHSTSGTSKSSDSPSPEAPQLKDIGRSSSSGSSGRNKRAKEDPDILSNEPLKNAQPNGTSTGNGNRNGGGRSKRKAKGRDRALADIYIDSMPSDQPQSEAEAPLGEEEEEQGITRCICGGAAEGEFMVQCETCDVWQHGPCMGYEAEDQLHEGNYYCEQCKPEQHQELLKKRQKRRHSSANSHHNPVPQSATAASRSSRSHSPNHAKAAKRRNTMNSRDAAYDESLKALIEATAAEAAANMGVDVDTNETGGESVNGSVKLEEEVDTGQASRRKRKRTDEDAPAMKRTRSASTASDRALAPSMPLDELPANEPPKAPSGTASSGKTSNARSGKRGGARKAAQFSEPPAQQESAEAKRQLNQYASRGRGGGSSTLKRAPPSYASQSNQSTTPHEHGTRRSHAGSTTIGRGPEHASTSATAGSSSSRAYHASHAYAVSQQPLFTSWGLPDYLAHLEPMLPSDVPKPLDIVACGEHAEERGVKVKWPSKRTSVGDMNKRVRALLEWVGREQAGAMERGRRKDSLEKALLEAREMAGAGHEGHDHTDDIGDVGELHMTADGHPDRKDGGATAEVSPTKDASQPSTMELMEELMKELINFQERFGPGSKGKDRDRRVVAAAAG